MKFIYILMSFLLAHSLFAQTPVVGRGSGSKKTGKELALKHLEEIKRILPPELNMYYDNEIINEIVLNIDFIRNKCEDVINSDKDISFPYYSISKSKTPSQFNKVFNSIVEFLPRVLNKKQFADADYGQAIIEIRIY